MVGHQQYILYYILLSSQQVFGALRHKGQKPLHSGPVGNAPRAATVTPQTNPLGAGAGQTLIIFERKRATSPPKTRTIMATTTPCTSQVIDILASQHWTCHYDFLRLTYQTRSPLTYIIHLLLLLYTFNSF